MLTNKSSIVVFVFAALSGFAQHAAAQTSTSYSVLSLIGDKLEIVTAVPATGSNQDRNQRQTIALNDPAFDNVALTSAEDAIKKYSLAAKVTLLRNTDARLFELQDRILDERDDSKELLKEVLLAAKNTEASFLILIVKYRGEARLKLNDGYIGQGKLTGLGFYIDYNKKTVSGDTGERGQGFLAPYSYIKVMLVDTQSGLLLHSDSHGEGLVRSVARAKDSFNPMDALTPNQKVALLEKIIQKEVSRLVPSVLRLNKLLAE